MLNQNNLKDLSTKLKNDIDNYCVQTYNDGFRSHLGASEIGHSCSKYLWFKFRWTFHKVHTASMYRLLQRGHIEEQRFKEYYEGIGCTVKLFDKVLLWHPESECLYYGPEEDCNEGYVNNVEGIYEFEQKAKEIGIYLDKGKRQIRISDCKGHFGGSLDAEIYLPKHYGIKDKFLGEMKTQGVGKKGDKFDKLVKEGVKKNKPVHWAQQCVYGFKRNLKNSIYISVNKNNDELHLEIIELDHFFGKDLIRKAEMIIFSQEPPQGIACNPSYYECSWCDAKDLCYNQSEPLKNCRSCMNAFPIDNSEWQCDYYNNVIPKDFIPLGCGEWKSIL